MLNSLLKYALGEKTEELGKNSFGSLLYSRRQMETYLGVYLNLDINQNMPYQTIGYK